MHLTEIVSILEGQMFLGEDKLHAEVFSACGSDLMSDVLCGTEEDIILLTGLNNCHVIRTADMAGINYIAFVRGKKPAQDVLSLAKELDMVILSTKLPLFEACGRLYKNGLGRKK